jgi:hypothetical protein
MRFVPSISVPYLFRIFSIRRCKRVRTKFKIRKPAADKASISIIPNTRTAAIEQKACHLRQLNVQLRAHNRVIPLTRSTSGYIQINRDGATFWMFGWNL